MNENQNKKHKLSLNQFKKTTEKDQEDVLKRRKAENTNKATKSWIDCLEDYLKDKGLGPLEGIVGVDLPKILETFYIDVWCQKVIVDEKGDPLIDANGDIQYEEYSNNYMRSLHAALSQFFKLKLNINIIENPAFICANELFAGKLCINKQEGKGMTRHKQPIS